MKYIKSYNIFEDINDSKIINIEGDKVTLINPEGKTVTIEIEEDGEYSEWIDPPYVKEISVSGDDDTYRYSMSAQTDDNNSFLEIDTDTLEIEKLSDIKDRENKIKAKNEEFRLQQKRLREIEAEQYKKDLEESGLSEDDFRKEERLKDLNLRYAELQKGIEHTGMVLALVEEPSYYEGKLEEINIALIKVPSLEIPEMEKDDDVYDEMVELLGGPSIEDIEKDLRDKNKIRKQDNLKDLIYTSKIKDPRNYLGRAPYYADVYDLIDDSELNRVIK